MKLLTAGVFAVLMVASLGGCARTQSAANTSFGRGSQPIATGIKPASQVAPCCRPFADGRIGLDQCMENPACIANNRSCCMNAIQ